MHAEWMVRVTLLLSTAGLLLLTDQPDVPNLRTQAPRLSATIAWHLVRDDEPTFLRFARRRGYMDLHMSIRALTLAPGLTSPATYRKTFAAIRPAWSRLASAILTEYRIPCFDLYLKQRDSLDVAAGVRMSRLLTSFAEVAFLAETRPDPALMVDSLDRALAWSDQIGNRELSLATVGERGAWLFTAKRTREAFASGAEFIERARRYGDMNLLAQSLGARPWGYAASEADSLQHYLDEAMSVAVEHRLVDQIARLLGFKASMARLRGNFVLGHELLRSALEPWQTVEGRGQKIRSMLTLATFYQRLECWDAVAQSVEGHRPLLEQLREVDRLRECSMYSRMVRQLLADRWLAVGRPDSAMAVLLAPNEASDGVYDRGIEADWTGYRARALAAAGRPDSALVELGNAIELAVSVNDELKENAWRYERAGILHDLGRDREAAADLAVIGTESDMSGSRPRDRVGLRALRALVSAGLGDHALARAELDTAFDIQWSKARAADAGAESYIQLADPDHVREAIQVIAIGDVEAGYRLELARRRWFTALGADRDTGRREPIRRPRSLEAMRLGEREAHLLYTFTGGRLLRYHATASGVSLDTLQGSWADWRDRVVSVRRALTGADSGAAGREQRISAVRSLDGLIPRRVLAAPGTDRIYITPDGPLGAVPFEVLDVGTAGSYVALGSRVEIATLRGLRKPAPPWPRVTVLADPEPGHDERLRHPELVPLPGALVEAKATTSMWPSAQVTSGRAATEGVLLEGWRDAGLIEVAAHLVRLREIPFYEYIPLAPDPASAERDRHADALEITDVRRLDLSRCRLVVLATCASGVPYVGGRRVGPSMADAFVDAGARAVLRTLRPIADDEAATYVSDFLAHWRAHGGDAIAAAATTTREHARSLGLAGDPLGWYAWSVEVNGEPGTPIPMKPATRHPADRVARADPAPAGLRH